MLGFRFEELVQMRPWELIHPEDLKQNLEERERLISGKAQQVSLETRYLRKDGSVVWIARTVALVRDAAGTPQYFVTVGQDVTDRKQFERKLREATELSSGAMTASRIAIFRWDLRSGNKVSGKPGAPVGRRSGRYVLSNPQAGPSSMPSTTLFVFLATATRARIVSSRFLLHPDRFRKRTLKPIWRIGTDIGPTPP